MPLRRETNRYWLAAPAGSALAVGVLLLLSWMIAPSSPREVHDNRVVLNLIAWQPPPVVHTATATPSVPSVPPTAKPAPIKTRPPVVRAPARPQASKSGVTVPSPPSIVTPIAAAVSSTTIADDTAVVAPSTSDNKDSTHTPVPIFELTALPRFIHQIQPPFPETMRHLAREGVVELNVLIDHTGTVRQVTIVRSAGSEFDRAARNAILASTFAPGEVDGKPVMTVLHLPVRFRLQ